MAAVMAVVALAVVAVAVVTVAEAATAGAAAAAAAVAVVAATVKSTSRPLGTVLCTVRCRSSKSCIEIRGRHLRRGH